MWSDNMHVLGYVNALYLDLQRKQTACSCLCSCYDVGVDRKAVAVFTEVCCVECVWWV
jgi:hypothetical protein